MNSSYLYMLIMCKAPPDRLNNWPHTIRSIACFHVIKTFYLVVIGSFPDVKFRSRLSVFDTSIDLIYFTLNLYYLYQMYVQPGT